MHGTETGAAGAQQNASERTVSRRAVIAGLVAVTAIGESEAAPSLHRRIDEAAATLATLMSQLHGGAWYADIDHEDPFVLIAFGEGP